MTSIAVQLAPASAQNPPDMAEIVADFQAGALESARVKLKALIDAQPTPNAHFRFGRMLLEGLGGPKQPEEGLAALRLAAQGGHLGAMSYLGRLYLTEGPSKNPEKAFQLFTRAAAGGDAEAKYYLSLLYQTGNGVPRDQTVARTWLEAAARDGFGLAQYDLSRAPDFPPNEARELQENAARSGVAAAQFAVAQRLHYGGGALQDFMALYERAAQAGHVPAQRVLGTLYLTGSDGLEPDGEKAEAWLRQAVRGKDLVALLNLGLGLLDGNVLRPNREEAEKLLLVASDNGAHQASLALSRAYRTEAIKPTKDGADLQFLRLADQQGSRPASRRLGQMVLERSEQLKIAPQVAVPWVMSLFEDEQSKAAFDWLTAEAREGNRNAQAVLGAWALGQDGQEDNAQVWLDAAARAGDRASQFRLGEALSTGRFGELDYVAAHSWLNLAAAAGHPKAGEIRDTLTDLMTAEDIAAAQDKARTYLEADPLVGGVRLP